MSQKLVVVKDASGEVVQYVEYEVQNPVSPAIRISDKNKALLYTIYIDGQSQRAMIKDATGNLLYTSQVEGEQVVVRDSAGNVLSSVPKPETQSAMPNIKMLENLTALNGLNNLSRELLNREPLNREQGTSCGISPSASTSVNIGDMKFYGDDLPPYLRQQVQQQYAVNNSYETPTYNPDFILNSVSTSCCGCYWCSCGTGGLGGAGGGGCQGQDCDDSPPDPNEDPCKSRCSPPPPSPHYSETVYMPFHPICPPCPEMKECIEDCREEIYCMPIEECVDTTYPDFYQNIFISVFVWSGCIVGHTGCIIRREIKCDQKCRKVVKCD
ncbi:MAG: hypothetical protein AB1546_16360 [bacterium]